MMLAGGDSSLSPKINAGRGPVQDDVHTSCLSDVLQISIPLSVCAAVCVCV